MSKRRRNRLNEPKPGQSRPSPATSTHRLNGQGTPAAAVITLTQSPLASSSSELLAPPPQPEAASTLPCGATQKSAMIELSARSLPTVSHEPGAAQTAEPMQGVVSDERRNPDSIPPLVSAAYEEAREVVPPEVIERRRRARKVVSLLIGAAALFFAFGVGKTALASRGIGVAGALSQSKEQVPSAQAMMGGRMNVLAHSLPAVVEQQASAVAAPAPASLPAVAESPIDPAEGAKLRKDAESLLNRGRFKDSIEVSRAAIAADPSQAMSYLLLGTALQSTGKWKEGLQAYSECVRNATRGPVHECSAVGGRK